MALRIRLLGRPTLTRDGERVRLEGHKTWGLLSYLALREGLPPTRRELAERLWPDASDPLGAARWTLSQVRRAIGPEASIAERDGRLAFETTAASSVDALELLHGAWESTSTEELLASDLLEGMEFDDTPEFARWLGIQRARVGSASKDALRETVATLAVSDRLRALALAERGLARDPYDDELHAHIVRMHTSSGDIAAARAYLATVGDRYRADLGIEPPPEIERAFSDALESVPVGVAADVHARALLDTALARSRSGDAAAAEALTRRAARAAAAAGDAGLESQALADAVNYMTMSQRGGPREWDALLRRSASLARKVGDRAALCDIDRQLGRIAALEGRYGAAEAALRRSRAVGEEIGDPHRVALADLFIGACETDRCELEAAEAHIRDALRSHERPEIVLAWLSRTLVRAGKLDAADEAASRAIAGSADRSSIAQVALAHAQRGEVELARGDPDAAAEHFSRAYTIASEIPDPDWMALSLRGLARIDRAERPARAHATMVDALRYATKGPSSYRWVEALVLTDLVEWEHARDAARLERALALTRAGPMPDLSARLEPYRASHTPRHTLRS